MADGETYENTNTLVTFLRLRDDVIHEGERLKAEIAVLADMLEEERQLKRGRHAWTWVDKFQQRVNRELGNTLHDDTYLEEHLRRRR